MIRAGDVSDHPAIAWLRQIHEELFAQVLRLCRAVGLVRLCTVAIDETVIAGIASKQAHRSAEWLPTETEKRDRESTEQQTFLGWRAAPAMARPGGAPGMDLRNARPVRRQSRSGRFTCRADDHGAAEVASIGCISRR